MLQVREHRRRDLAALAEQQVPRAQLDQSQPYYREIAVLPYLESKLAPPSVERLRRVEALLQEIANQAHSVNFPVTQNNIAPHEPVAYQEAQNNNAAQVYSKRDRLLGAACATCGGQCCRPGGDTGFLNLAKFTELLQKSPNLNTDEIVLEYMQRIPTETVADSCIFHGREGCVLPKEYRTVTCNTYMCPSLQQLRDDVDQGKSNFLLVATNVRETGDIKIYRIVPQPD